MTPETVAQRIGTSEGVMTATRRVSGPSTVPVRRSTEYRPGVDVQEVSKCLDDADRCADEYLQSLAAVGSVASKPVGRIGSPCGESERRRDGTGDVGRDRQRRPGVGVDHPEPVLATERDLAAVRPRRIERLPVRLDGLVADARPRRDVIDLGNKTGARDRKQPVVCDIGDHPEVGTPPERSKCGQRHLRQVDPDVVAPVAVDLETGRLVVHQHDAFPENRVVAYAG
jgi:hypothetical protein